MKYILTISLFFLLYFLSGCSNTTVDTNNNSISTRSVNDTLAIALSATNYSGSQDIEMYFSVDSVKLSLAVTGYGSGSGSFKLYEDTALVYSKDLSSNNISEQKVLFTRPTKAAINFSGYKGNASILVTQ